MNSINKILFKGDFKLFTAVTTLMLIGLIIVMAAGPAVAERISLTQFFFIEKQIIYVIAAFLIMIFFAAINESVLKIVINIGFIFICILLVAVLLFGNEIKGAKRWFSIFGFSMQPSEFLKPFYCCVVAIILSKMQPHNMLHTFVFLLFIHGIIITLLLLQPDFGMAIVISAVFYLQLFIAGIPIILLLGLCFLFLIGMLGVYYSFPHVAKRIEKFLDFENISSNYQVQKSLESYESGGLLGKGPGEGVVKYQLPDSHTDFIFPVAAEELGIIFCIGVILLIMYIVLRCFIDLTKIRYSLYRIYCGVGVVGYFALQSIFNIGMTLNLLPTKGMTLPLISYGGSSIIAQAIGMGIFLNITRYISKVGLKKYKIHAKL